MWAAGAFRRGAGQEFLQMIETWRKRNLRPPAVQPGSLNPAHAVLRYLDGLWSIADLTKFGVAAASGGVGRLLVFLVPY